MPYKPNHGGPATAEKIWSAVCYLTGGIAGIVYIIISRSSFQSDFFRFHFLQSVVITIISVLVGWCFKFFFTLVPPSVTVPAPVYMVVDGVSYVFMLIAIIGAICALLGKRFEIPWLSAVVRNQMR